MAKRKIQAEKQRRATNPQAYFVKGFMARIWAEVRRLSTNILKEG